MDTQINFYIMNKPKLSDCHLFICRLANKAYRQGYQITIKADSEASATSLDDALWTLLPESFMPHQITEEDNTKITIGRPTKEHLLVDLTLTPSFEKEIKQLITIVPDDIDLKQKARELYKTYKNDGYSIKTQPIN